MAEDILRKEALPATTPRYQYQGIEQCLRCFELELERYRRDGQRGDSYVIFDHVDDRSFWESWDDSVESLLLHSFVSYNFISHTIILQMVTPMRETANHAFSEIFALWHRRQENRLFPRGRTTVAGLTREKSPDSCWTTSVQVPGRDTKWPTVVIEAGWSEPIGKLEQDVLFWLRESEQQVKVALTINVTRRGSITIQQWSLNTACRSPIKPVKPV
jgi:hypothetical protein